MELLLIGFFIGLVSGGIGVGFAVYRMYVSKKVQAILDILIDRTIPDSEKIVRLLILFGVDSR